ncbi:hypothetical protein PUR31_01265 [Pseudomonas mosselii]|uniref:hypothetical protein n=1 Tax=unclassified Pseudomonas TaxID=196821 RepID=UPI0020C3D769|nr:MULTISPECIES: hypothetical protein [unclassified Pseudomonas]MCP8634158.1 hypothetical protein [Pseudomonas sp. DVZ6]MDD7782720.1 hypothetical protein [Pseudomonas sp. DVZ24]
MKAACFSAASLLLISTGGYCADPLIAAIPTSVQPTIAYGEFKVATLVLQLDVPQELAAEIADDGIKWETNDSVFGSIEAIDTRGRVNAYPIKMSGESPSIRLRFTLTPQKSHSLNNNIKVTYQSKGSTHALDIPVRISGACINADYETQQCDPQMWTCQIDRNKYPVLRIERPATDNQSLEAVWAHDAAHRQATATYKIPFLQFVAATGIGNIDPPPSCEMDPFLFTKTPHTERGASFLWQQNPNARTPQLTSTTTVNGVEISKIVLDLPDMITGYSSVNGGTAEYRFDPKDAPTLTISQQNVIEFQGLVECILADGSLSVIRNRAPDADSPNAKQPKMHLIIEKP